MSTSTTEATVAGLPTPGPATVSGVRRHLGHADTDTRDQTRLESLVAAVNAKVRAWPVAAKAAGLADWTDPAVADVVEGATMLAARLYRRKNSPAGVEAFGADGAVYVQRNDPDIALLLELGNYGRPVVG